MGSLVRWLRTSLGKGLKEATIRSRSLTRGSIGETGSSHCGASTPTDDVGVGAEANIIATGGDHPATRDAGGTTGTTRCPLQGCKPISSLEDPEEGRILVRWAAGRTSPHDGCLPVDNPSSGLTKEVKGHHLFTPRRSKPSKEP
ncbi:hypothetical protein B296_00058795 [Ensete ventricosum]|uniref:Uncharacterized protein n=1 Tax=Ensete ventricosum TaxID=4639 RepID=A0A426XKH8_ENSVE|nr:hypothetical protein B296_00058795 [Ensete ventricosum]